MRANSERQTVVKGEQLKKPKQRYNDIPVGDLVQEELACGQKREERKR